jgi:hypothetical protein
MKLIDIEGIGRVSADMRRVLGESGVARWVEHAKTLDRVVHH